MTERVDRPRIAKWWAFALMFLSPAITAAADGKPFELLREKIVFERGCSPNAWIKDIIDDRDDLHYRVAIEPIENNEGRLCGWNVCLYAPGRSDRNLLEPKGNWHGLEPFNLVDADLKRGAAQSVFGNKRIINSSDGRVIVTIAIDDAKLSQDVTAPNSFERLALQIMVESRK